MRILRENVKISGCFRCFFYDASSMRWHLGYTEGKRGTKARIALRRMPRWEEMEMRFSRMKVAVAAFSFFLAASGTAFAMSAAEDDEAGRQQMMNQAVSYGWELSSRTYSPDKDLEANVFNEILWKSGVGMIMQAEGREVHLPYIVPSDNIEGGFGYHGGHCVMSTAEVRSMNVTHLEQYGKENVAKRSNKPQEIYANTLVAGTYIIKTGKYISGLAIMAMQQKDAVGSIGGAAGTMLQELTQNDYEDKGDAIRITFLANTPYLSPGGVLGTLRRRYYMWDTSTAVGNRNTFDVRFYKVEDAIKEWANGGTEVKSLEAPLLYVNGHRILPYSIASDIRQDVDHFERVLYVHGKVAQAMHDGTWNRSDAVLKRESELFGDGSDDNYLYLCLPMPESKLLDDSWEKWMVVDKYYIPEGYENGGDNVPWKVQEELDKMNSLLNEMK